LRGECPERSRRIPTKQSIILYARGNVQ
jgi:hypothetical protein